MRFLILLMVPACLAAQDSNQRVTEALISEMQQLRLAIERSTLLGARTQLAISQLQLSENALSRVAQLHNDAKMALGDTTLKRNQFAEHLRGLEQQRSSTTNPQEAAQMEEVIKGLKLQLNEATAAEQQQMTRESELAGQLQKAQNDIADSRARIAEMERMLDAAIQQLLKGK